MRITSTGRRGTIGPRVAFLPAGAMLFQCDPDLRLANSEIYLDPAESRPLAILSHAHADHIGRHAHFVATPATASFLRARQGADLRGTELAFGETHAIGEWSARLHPAGHVLGSAMVELASARGTLLYTGDFRLAPGYTAEPVLEIPHADVVIMESTYGGGPEWSFPTREELRERLITLVHAILARDSTPVLLAYSLGKAQEATAMLREAGAPIVQHPVVSRLSSIYARHGVDLGVWKEWGSQSSLFGARTTRDLRYKILIVPPHLRGEVHRIARKETVMLSGWTLRGTRDADHGLPLSDHADYGELLRFAETSGARTIYVTHGSARFAADLRRRGIRAEFLRRKPQMRLF
jgi:putative mRNA 3-end processing factor